MHIFKNKYHSKIGVRISAKPFGLKNDVLPLPLYMISELSRIAQLVE